MSETKKPILATEKEIKLLERTRKIKYAKDILLSIVDGQPIEIGEHIEKERL
jgi:hypothetical protein